MAETLKGAFSIISVITVFSLSLFLMDSLRIGSLNMNGGRDRNKRGQLNELCSAKHLDIVYLQETHSTHDNVVDWGMSWGGQHFHSHDTNLSAGVAILFSPRLIMTDVSFSQVEQGRVIIVQATIRNTPFTFINVYAYCSGTERVRLFNSLNNIIGQYASNSMVVLGGDWNCTCFFKEDRTGKEPHPQSASVLSSVVTQHGLKDTWRELHPVSRQYSWTKVSEGRISAARLDRIYVNTTFSNRVRKAAITPVGFSDHHLMMVELSLSVPKIHSPYWHFNIRLMQDQLFCDFFSCFWKEWRGKKNEFENVISWWEVGKVQIKVFCQQYAAHTAATQKNTMERLEEEIKLIEKDMINRGDPSNATQLGRKTHCLALHLQQKAKGALIGARISTLKDMDAPTSYFFKLERKIKTQNLMLHLKRPNGDITTDTIEMRTMAMDFYRDLFSAKECVQASVGEIHKDLPKLTSDKMAQLDSDIKAEEVSAAVQELNSGRSPGIDGLPAEFYKCFWGLFKDDLCDVFKCCFQTGRLPVSCTRAVLSLLPKKGDLGLLNNWRPVSLLCTDYKILSKCLSNRLKKYMDTVIHANQTYCVPGRTIMDNLFLMRDVIDLSNIKKWDLGILSIDQRKAFDVVDHEYLFKTLEAFGIGKCFVSWVKLLYSGASVVLKVGGGLSSPVRAYRGIRQGCPLSGQLYCFAIEPLLHTLRKGLGGLTCHGAGAQSAVALSAYADDVTVFIRGQEDVECLIKSLTLYEQASSARVNWEKCEGYALGQWQGNRLPTLPAALQWNTEGMKCLGVFLGNSNFQKKNWEGMIEKVSARLSQWTWVLPQLSYRGRVLVANNLIASMFWHRFTVLDPPDTLLKEIQKRLVNFFWSGQHWIRASALFLPLAEGGQGLIDLRSRVTAFRLQTAQRLLYREDVVWTDIACCLLRTIQGLEYDKHLFMLDLDKMDLSATTGFYQSVLRAWNKVLKPRWDGTQPYGKAGEEPLFYNPLIQSRMLSSAAVERVLVRAGIVKLADLRSGGDWKTAENLSEQTGLKSHRFLQQLLREVVCALPGPLREALGREPDDGQNVRSLTFPALEVSAAVDEWEEEDGLLLSFKTPQLGDLQELTSKTLYAVSVKINNKDTLVGVKESRWSGILAPGSSPRGSWRAMYKSPVEKRTADLQWRIVHGAVATNRHVAHIDSRASKNCPFCQEDETLEHLWLRCPRLGSLFALLQGWFRGFNEVLSDEMFIFGPKYKASQKARVGLLNFLVAQVKMSIWLSRRNKIQGAGSVEAELMTKGLVAARIRIEFSYHKMISRLEEFVDMWGQDYVLCSVEQELLVLTF